MKAPILCWIRRDLRLADNQMLSAAAGTGRPVIPVFLLDPEAQALGAAPKWRLGQGLAVFADGLQALGSRLILRRGPAVEGLRALIDETGADTVWWHRLYDGASVARDRAVKSALTEAGIDARSFPGHVLFEPWKVETGSGGPYRVYSPFWRAVRGRPVGASLRAPATLVPPAAWPGSDDLADWRLGAAMNRGAGVVAKYARVGAAAAQARLDEFLHGAVTDYARLRDFPGAAATSGLSENLTYGEISPRQIWNAGLAALEVGAGGAETFLKELAWREFAYHLIYHFPAIERDNWRPEWDAFPWRGDNADAEAWRRGRTGEPLVDAAMRELLVTGTMHNRARMIAASYLTKHLLTHWRVGLDWFADCLIDWDPASNAMGWQWVAGSGPDAAPYFRVFNPATQAEKFDKSGAYRRNFLHEGQSDPPEAACDFLAAAPRLWGLSRGDEYPARRIELAEGRARALAAYQAGKGGGV